MAFRPDSGLWSPPYGASRLHSLDTSGRTISQSQRPSPDNTQHSQQTDIYAPAGSKTANPVSERRQTCALDRTATEIGGKIYYNGQFRALAGRGATISTKFLESDFTF